MNTYCDDCKRCTGGNMRKSDVPGWDDHNRCWECEATLQAGMAEADAMISDLRAERDALRERCGKLARILKHSQDVFDAIDMTGLCPLCQGDEDHNSGCPMRAVEEEIQTALAATEVKP